MESKYLPRNDEEKRMIAEEHELWMCGKGHLPVNEEEEEHWLAGERWLAEVEMREAVRRSAQTDHANTQHSAPQENVQKSILASRDLPTLCATPPGKKWVSVGQQDMLLNDDDEIPTSHSAPQENRHLPGKQNQAPPPHVVKSLIKQGCVWVSIGGKDVLQYQGVPQNQAPTHTQHRVGQQNRAPTNTQRRVGQQNQAQTHTQYSVGQQNRAPTNTQRRTRVVLQNQAQIPTSRSVGQQDPHYGTRGGDGGREPRGPRGPCRYGAGCPNNWCHFTHPRNGLPKQLPCRNGSACVTPQCGFAHPCPHGDGCRNPNCVKLHSS